MDWDVSVSAVVSPDGVRPLSVHRRKLFGACRGGRGGLRLVTRPHPRM